MIFAPFSIRPEWMDAIPRRFSCRRFDPYREAPDRLFAYAGALSLPGVRIQTAMADESGSPFFNLPPFTAFSGVRAYAAVVLSPDQFVPSDDLPNLRMAAGMLGEAFVLEAAAMGVGTCWVAGNFRRSKCDVALREGEKIAALIPFGYGEDTESAHGRKPLKRLCRRDPSDWPLWAFRAAEAVRGAPSALNRQPWRFDFSGSTLWLSFKAFDSLDAGVALCHLHAALQGMPCALSFDQRHGAVFVNMKKDEAKDAAL